MKESYDKRRSNQEGEALKKIRRDPGAFYKYAKKFSKSTSDIGPFTNHEGEVITEARIITDMLKTQYETVYSKPVKENIVSNPQEFFGQCDAEEQFNSFIIDREDIILALDSLSSKSSAGPDGVPSILLKNCKRSLADPLLSEPSFNLEYSFHPQGSLCGTYA